MGAYVSIQDCQSHYNVTLDCTVGNYDNSTHKYDSLGNITRGEFEADPDIAGVGVLGVFIAVTSFALAVSIMDLVWQAVKTFELRTPAQTREDKRLGPKKKSLSDILETLVQACSDQQIFTGAAYALTLRYWKGCSISAYHYNIVANILLLTCATHLMSATIIRNYWKYPLLAAFRVLCVTGVFIVTGVLMSNQDASNDPNFSFPTAVPPSNETDSLMFMAAACFQDSDSHLINTLQESTTSADQFFLNAIGNSEPKNKIQGWRWYLVMLIFYGAAIIAEFIRFCRRSQNRPGVRGRLGKSLRKYIGNGTRTKRLIKYGFLLYLIAGIGVSSASVVFCAIYIFQLRQWVDRSGWIALNNGSNPENDATSFGQLVPIFLSALILFTFLQTISEKITDQFNRKHADDEDKPPQIGTIGYLDPSHYDIISMGGKPDLAYNGYSGAQIATPGTLDLESAQPWPSNKPVARYSDTTPATTPGLGINNTSPLLRSNTEASIVEVQHSHPNALAAASPPTNWFPPPAATAAPVTTSPGSTVYTPLPTQPETSVPRSHGATPARSPELYRPAAGSRSSSRLG